MPKQKADISESELDDVLVAINNTYGYDFSDYSKASVQRRVTRFMDIAAYERAYDLKLDLINNKAVFEHFLQRITVNVTEMFRDPGFYTVIREEVLPVLATYPIIKIWHAGCSTGEEVFSMAILLHEAGLLKRSRIYGTDINPHNIEKAKKGIMPFELMKDYKENYLQSGGKNDFTTYYTSMYNNAIIRKDLRENILFSQHNLVTDQAFNEFQLICCRNVMIYFNRKLQNRVIHLFNDSLSTFGYLALGIKESLLFTDLQNRFEVVSKEEKIFRRAK